MNSSPEMTLLLRAVEEGEADEMSRLLDRSYEELRKMASGKMANEKAGHLLQPTALMHEAYLRIFGEGEESQDCDKAQHWNHRGHFFRQLPRPCVES